ncbi:MAG: type III pantothenate kinase [Deltaproteobacteria bacterium]|jgi:type III pantothenate kinase|nr:type III pantothenate kinase [Deltaproteobacteria bacterium]
MEKIIITMDVGNSNMKFGLWFDDHMKHTWRVNTHHHSSGDELGLLLEGFLRLHGLNFRDVSDLVVANVVLPMRPPIERLGNRYLGKPPIIVEAFSQKIMPVKYDNPKEVGADRVVGAIAAYERYKDSLVVVDFGTATTFDCISKAGEYIGGAIAPGFRLSAEALFDRARRLPRMEQFARPKAAMATNTLDSLNSGLVLGYAGLVEGMITRIRRELGPLRVVATGGLASLIAEEATVIEKILPHLTMEGLKIIYDREPI